MMCDNYQRNKTKKFSFVKNYKCINSGFTLIELLVVISIIALLMSILMPSLQRARRIAKETVCVSNLRQLGIALFAYENDNGRLPLALVEDENVKIKFSWPEEVSDNLGVDHREMYLPYLSDLNFLNCPLLKSLDISVEAIPLGERRIYCGYEFVFGYWKNRTSDGTWGNEGQRWKRTSGKWMYEGKNVNVLAGDRMYYSEGQNYYRINHGMGLNLQLKYVDYESSRSDGYCVSVYEQFGVADNDKDLRESATAAYVLKDGSAVKYKGDDSVMFDIYAPSNQDSVQGGHLIPLR